MTPSEEKLMMYQESEMDKEAGPWDWIKGVIQGGKAISQMAPGAVNMPAIGQAAGRLSHLSGVSNRGGVLGNVNNAINPVARWRNNQAATTLQGQIQLHGEDAVRQNLMRAGKMTEEQANQIIAQSRTMVGDSAKGRIAQQAFNMSSKNIDPNYVAALQQRSPVAATVYGEQQAAIAKAKLAKEEAAAAAKTQAEQQALKDARDEAQWAHGEALQLHSKELNDINSNIQKLEGYANTQRGGLNPSQQQMYNQALARRDALNATPPSFDKYHQDVLNRKGLAAPLKAPAAPAAPAAAAGTPAAPVAPTTPPDFMESLKGGWNNLRMGKMPEGHQILPLAMTAYAGDTVIDKFKS